eukprot:11467236-Karenia_brevis.AAC.1
MVTTTAAIANQCQEALLEREVRCVESSGCVPVILKWYDTTPMTVRFGRLQQQIAPHARYPVLAHNTWKAVSYDEYVRIEHGRRPPRFG